MTDPTYIVFTGDSKREVLDPCVVGPFASSDEVARFLDSHPRFDAAGYLEPIDGGYAGAVEVGPETAMSPDAYMEAEMELEGEAA